MGIISETHVVLSLWLCTSTPCGHVRLSPGERREKQSVKSRITVNKGCFQKRWVALWVGAEHSDPISGDQVVHATTGHFRRWVSVKTIRLNSLTFFNLHQAKTFNSTDATTTTLFMRTKTMNLQFLADSL